jgi:hypothetical protein
MKTTKIISKLLEVTESTYLLECLVDSDKSIYEERYFNKSLFEGYPDKIGTLFIIELTQLKNEERIKIIYDKSLSDDLFPKLYLNLSKLFKESDLFKK